MTFHVKQPSPLLRQNSELRSLRVWNWTLPAGPVTLEDGRRVNACPNADGCLALCYARNGTYLFPVVQQAHKANMAFAMDDIDGWSAAMLDELAADRFRPDGRIRRLLSRIPESDPWARSWAYAGGAAVRIHDAGDFFSEQYLRAWLDIARFMPDILFYAYTKEVSLFRRCVEERAPINFRWLYSLGGKEDHLLDLEVDRHAEVFPNSVLLESAGYLDQSASDLLAVLAPSNRIGIEANRIPAARKKQGGRTFGEIQQARHDHRAKAHAMRPDLPVEE